MVSWCPCVHACVMLYSKQGTTLRAPAKQGAVQMLIILIIIDCLTVA